MVAKSNSERSKDKRKRLLDQGLVKREVWIKPEYTERLRKYEKRLRK